MDPPVPLHVCSFYLQELESFHDYSFHIPHMDPPISLKCVFFSLTTARVIACVFSLETTYGSTSVIVCVFFLLTTTRVIAYVFFSHTTYGSTSVIEMCVLFSNRS